jgi:hypothetical protein
MTAYNRQMRLLVKFRQKLSSKEVKSQAGKTMTFSSTNCKHCGSPFPARQRQEYCSPQCRPSFSERKTTRRRGVVTNGYPSYVEHGHPRANKKSGQLAVHVAVAYAKCGPGPHKCHWCDRNIDWERSQIPLVHEDGAPITTIDGRQCYGNAEKLMVDHVNGNKDDWAEKNVVLSCRRCNTLRGAPRGTMQYMTREHRVAFLQSIAEGIIRLTYQI